MILWAWLNTGSHASPLTISVELDRFEKGTAADLFVNAAYKGLMIRLVGEGLAVVDATANAELRVHLVRRPAAIEIRVRSAVRTLQAKVPLSALGESDQLRLMHTTLELVRAARAELQARPAAQVTSKRATPASLPTTASTTTRARPLEPARTSWSFGARAEAGVMLSSRNVGLLAEVGAVAHRGAWMLGLVGGVHRPLGIAPDLSLLEWGMRAALGYRASLGARLALEPGVALGFWQHRYDYADATGAADSGSWLGPTAAAHLRLWALLAKKWRVGLLVGTFVMLHARVHETVSRTLWRGPQLRPMTTLTLERLW